MTPRFPQRLKSSVVKMSSMNIGSTKKELLPTIHRRIATVSRSVIQLPNPASQASPASQDGGEVEAAGGEVDAAGGEVEAGKNIGSTPKELLPRVPIQLPKLASSQPQVKQL